jgi:hypothetical protein
MSRLAECRHEGDLVAAVTSGRWPAAVDQAMRDHVAACEVCAEVLQVSEAMAAIEQETLADTRLPSAGQVWWRSQLRARRDAAATAARPVLVAQAVGGAAAVGLIAAVVSWQWTTISTAAMGLGLVNLGLATWVGVATAAVLGPLVIYAAVRE